MLAGITHKHAFYLVVSVPLAYEPSCKAHSINVPGAAKFLQSVEQSDVQAAQMQSVCGLNADFLPLMVSIYFVCFSSLPVSLSILKKSRIFLKKEH